MEKEKQKIPGSSISGARGWGTFVTLDTNHTKMRRCEDRDYADDEPIPIDCFYAFPIDKDVPYWGKLVREVGYSLEVPPKPSDRAYIVLVAVHVTTRETPDWVWATFWWHNRASDFNYGWDRPGTNVLKGNKWRHFLMDTTLSGSTPLELDYGHKICFNRFLEAEMPYGLVSNCIQCHKRAVYSPQNQNEKEKFGYRIDLEKRCTDTAQGTLPKCDSFVPESCKQGAADYYTDYYKQVLQTDFLWTIPLAQNEDTELIQDAFVKLLMSLQLKP
jgi:hypothetical protein